MGVGVTSVFVLLPALSLPLLLCGSSGVNYQIGMRL